MLKLERIYTKPVDLSGHRIFVDRLWARGISKADAKLDAWNKEVAPSAELREWFQHVNNKYPEFKQRYIAELKQNPAMNAFMDQIKALADQGDVILLYGAKNTKHNNAVVLAEYLSAELNLPVADPQADFRHFYYNDGESNTTKQLPNDVAWLQDHPNFQTQLGLELDVHRQHIIYNGKNLNHLELFKLNWQ